MSKERLVLLLLSVNIVLVAVILWQAHVIWQQHELLRMIMGQVQ